jgi:Flp pilus assembly protein TadG
MMRLRFQRDGKARRGTTTVEFAIVFPVFVALVFFFFETWRYQQFQQAVDEAALEAARVAIVPGATATQAQAQGKKLLNGIGAPTATVNVSPNPIAQSTDQVTITVSLPYSDVGLFFKYFAKGKVFTSTLTMDTENKRIGRL